MAWPPLHGLRGPRFDRRTITIAPGRSRAYDEHEWRDAIVVIERGPVEVEGARGSRLRFLRGDILWLQGLPLRAIHNPGREQAVLITIRRRRTTTAG
jgi:hypothetical protein